MTIDRRSFIVSSSAAAAAVILWPQLGLEAAQAQPFTELRGGVGTFTGQGGTIGWYVSKDAVVVIDSQFPRTARNCLKGVQQRASRPIDLLINTHHHGDHTNGNPVFRDHVQHIVAHENVPTWQWNQARERELKDPTVADILYRDGMTLDVGDETIRLTYHGRAHTSGDSIIHFEEANIVHVGDLVFNRYPAFIDRDAGATIHGWMSILDIAHSTFDDETLFIFGHGKTITGSRADLPYMRDFLGGLLAFAEAGIKAGKTKEEVSTTKRLPDFPDNFSPGWENGISNGLEKAYEELTED